MVRVVLEHPDGHWSALPADPHAAHTWWERCAVARRGAALWAPVWALDRPRHLEVHVVDPQIPEGRERWVRGGQFEQRVPGLVVGYRPMRPTERRGARVRWCRAFEPVGEVDGAALWPRAVAELLRGEARAVGLVALLVPEGAVCCHVDRAAAA